MELAAQYITPFTNVNLSAHSRYYEDATQQDLVNVHAKALPTIPPNRNAFNYDSCHTGTELAGGWVVMYRSVSKDQPLPYLILVNQVSGQRIQVNLCPEHPTPYPMVRLEVTDRLQTFVGGSSFLYRVGLPITPKDAWINWWDLRQVGQSDSPEFPAFAKIGEWMVRLDVLLDRDLFYATWEEYTCAVPPSEAVYQQYVTTATRAIG